jgi:hypothetical protein
VQESSKTVRLMWNRTTISQRDVRLAKEGWAMQTIGGVFIKSAKSNIGTIHVRFLDKCESGVEVADKRVK